MRKSPRFAFNLALAILLPTLALAQFKPNLERYQLENGFTVILNYDPDQTGVFGAIGVKVGSKNDPSDATGMAHYQEHMLFKGTTSLGTLDWEKEKPYIDSIFAMYDELGKTKDEERRLKIQKKINDYSVKANEFAAPNEFSNLIKSIGGVGLNAFTSPDMTVYHNAFPANQMEKWLELYSHRFIDPVFRGFQSELEVVYEEYNMNADFFVSKLLEEFNKNLFKNHPYGTQTTIGTVEHLKSPSLTKMYDFFKKYYVANNMVLVLSGNFDVKTTKPLIASKFGRLRKAEVNGLDKIVEAPFNGRELVEVKMSPVKIGGMAFRTVPEGHPDELKLQVLNAMLNNESGSGLLDKLSVDNELLAASIQPMPYHDLGATLVIFVPKIIGQKLEEAEKLVLTELRKMHKGEFEDWQLQSAKNNLYMREQQALESKESVALNLINAEMLGLDLGSVFSTSQRIKEITREEVIEAAKKYYGDNYLAFYSKMKLNNKKEKVSKPSYAPVVPNEDVESDYASTFNDIEAGEAFIKYINFEKDITHKTILNGNSLYMAENPKNDVFSMRMEFEVGAHDQPILEYAASMMSLAGTEDIKAKSLMDTFNYYNCSFNSYATETKVIYSLTGLEDNLEKVLPYLNSVMQNPKFSESSKKTLVQGTRAERLFEKTQGDALADALWEYALYGESSAYLDRYTFKEVKKMDLAELEEAMVSVNDYKCTIHYVGRKDVDKVRMALDLHMEWAPKPLPGDLDYYKKVRVAENNTIYFTNKKSARQSSVNLMTNAHKYESSMSSPISGFNLYFGGDFSGLVLQEIREYRSLAYTAGAYISKPSFVGQPARFTGRVATQADKTNEAIDVYMDLLKNMPHKEDRMDMIRQYLINTAQNNQPGFRYLTRAVVNWQNMGYTKDPRRTLLKEYKKLTFEDIVNYYESFQQSNIVTMAIMGDKRQIDLEALEQYGTVVEMKRKKLFSK